MEPILAPTYEDEVEAIQRAVIASMHVLVEMAQDESLSSEDRIMAVEDILAYAQESRIFGEPNGDGEDDGNDDDGPSPEDPQTNWPTWSAALWQGLGLLSNRRGRKS